MRSPPADSIPSAAGHTEGDEPVTAAAGVRGGVPRRPGQQRQRMAAANAEIGRLKEEIGRLKEEIAILKARGHGAPGGATAGSRFHPYPLHRDPHALAASAGGDGPSSAAPLMILPRRALTLAGYWNVLANDVLSVTPTLAAAVEARGGAVLRRPGMNLCFSGADRALVIEAVLEVMPLALPQYRRRKWGE